METHTALAELADAVKTVGRGSHLPANSLCAQAAATLFSLTVPEKPQDCEFLEEVRTELLKVCACGESASLRGNALRFAALVFWDREPQAASFPGLFDFYLSHAAERPRLLRELVEAWLRDFGPDRVRHAEAGAAAAAMLEQTSDPRLSPWAQAHRRFALFDAAVGPERVGTALLCGPEPVDGVLAAVGMDHPLRTGGGFFRAALRCMLAMLPEALCTPRAAEAWGRASSLLEVQHVTQDRGGRETKTSALRDGRASGEVIVGCLDAWRSGKVHSSASRADVTAFLLRVVNDPRLDPSHWKAAPDDYAQLMRGWLAEKSLEAFFALISQTNEDTQWRFRRAFWRACLRKVPQGQSAEVWVVLTPGMAMRAKAVRDLVGNYATMSGNAGEQAVLLLRFGDIVMSEWSNVGPIRAWKAEDRRYPKLYRNDYDPGSLRLPSLVFPHNPSKGGSNGLYHHGPERGLWQGRAANFLKDRVGLHLQPADYMTP